MKNRILLGCFMLLVGVGMIAYSFTRTFAVYDADLPADDFTFYQDVREIALSRDGTFAGVKRSESSGRLVTTYDRDHPPGRVACPT